MAAAASGPVFRRAASFCDGDHLGVVKITSRLEQGRPMDTNLREVGRQTQTVVRKDS